MQGIHVRLWMSQVLPKVLPGITPMPAMQPRSPNRLVVEEAMNDDNSAGHHRASCGQDTQLSGRSSGAVDVWISLVFIFFVILLATDGG